MLIKEFAQYLKNKKENKNSINTLLEWLNYKLENPSVTNIDKILHTELYIAKNKVGCNFIIARGNSGRVLLNALYNFCEYYDNYKKAKN